MADTIAEMDSELKHVGVKGMKWGVRKDRSSGSSGAPLSTDRKKADAAMNKPSLQSMSNKQLQTANQRLQLERTYKDLTKQPGFTEKVAAGNKKVGVYLGVAGTAAATYKLAKSPAGQAAIRSGIAFVKKNNKSLYVMARAQRAFG